MLGVGQLAKGLGVAGGGKVERGGVLHEEERSVGGGDEAEGVAAVGLVEVGGLDVRVVEEVVGGLCRGGGAGGGGDGLTGVFQERLGQGGGAAVESLVAEVLREEVGCTGHGADISGGPC
jgi:hypothetical protein